MVYNFKSLFNREKEYTIDTEEPLDLYNTFSLSMKKFDAKDKSFAYDNIVCVLKYGKKGVLELQQIELDQTNFSGFYLMVEVFKQRNCLSMGEPLELIKENPFNEFENVNLENAEEELKLEFNKYVENNDIMNTLFKCFLKGVSYGKKKNSSKF